MAQLLNVAGEYSEVSPVCGVVWTDEEISRYVYLPYEKVYLLSGSVMFVTVNPRYKNELPRNPRASDLATGAGCMSSYEVVGDALILRGQEEPTK